MYIHNSPKSSHYDYLTAWCGETFCVVLLTSMITTLSSLQLREVLLWVITVLSSIINFIHQVNDILNRIQYGKDDDQVGIARLISNHSFANAYPIHDVRTCVYIVIYNIIISARYAKMNAIVSICIIEYMKYDYLKLCWCVEEFIYVLCINVIIPLEFIHQTKYLMLKNFWD